MKHNIKHKKTPKIKEEVLVIKRLTYTRIFIVISLLMFIDIISSYIAINTGFFYELNSLGAKMFNLGIFGLILFLSLGVFIMGLVTLFAYTFETTFVKSYKQLFRMRLFYFILGMYLYVFSNNLKALIFVLLNT